MPAPAYGPVDSWPIISECRSISDAAAQIETEHIQAASLTRPVEHLFTRILYNGKTTSFSIHLLNSWVMILPALGLLHIQAEQCVVASYLIHEERSLGLEAFVQHVSVARYLQASEAIADARISSFLPQGHGEVLERMESEARSSQALDRHGRFKRKWTDLDIRSMARRRDVLAKRLRRAGVVGPCNYELELSYLSVYRYASSVVHAECDSLSYNYLDVYAADATVEPVLMGRLSWVPIVASFCTLYDLIQVSETLRWLGRNAVVGECAALFTRWERMREGLKESPLTP